MHQDVEKLLNAAKEKGFITEKQRDIILNKAQQLGEDMAEVEFMLEDITIKKGTNEKVKSKKCPNCGALIDDLALKCPECGYAFKDESDANFAVRKIIDETEKRIEAAQNSDREKIKLTLKKGKEDGDEVWDVEIDEVIEKNVLAAIRAFKVPYTQSALIQAYEYSYGQFEHNKMTNTIISSAWLGKCKELYGLIRSQPHPDNDAKVWIETHADIMKASAFPKWIWGIIAGIGVIVALIVIFG